MKPYISLGFYRPKRWNARIIGHELVSLTEQAGFIPHHDARHGPLALKGRNWSSVALHAEVRRRTFKTTQAEGWHYDADLEPEGNPKCHIVAWASNNPTQIRWKGSEEIFQPEPYEVVIFDNMKCVHRRPPNCPRMRWLFRQRVTPK